MLGAQVIIAARHILVIALAIAALLRSSVAETPASSSTHSMVQIHALGSNSPPIAIDLPGDFGLKTKDGPDFTVYYIGPLDEKSANSNACVTIYVGWAPSLFSSRLPREIVKAETRVTAGSKVDWFSWQETSSGAARMMREAHLKGFFRGLRSDQGTDWGGLMVHVFIAADNPATLERLQQSVDNMKLLR